MTTIREQLKARMFKARLVAFGFWLLFAAGMFLPKGNAYAALLFIPFVGFAASVLYVIFFVRCPKCGARLGQAMSSMSKPNFCPGCGVSFDTRT
jgi:hypothetical protein